MTINKKAGMELSMGTIIILVLGVSMLVLGIVLIRSIMCSGLQITDQLSIGVTNEVKNLFGADKFGVKCVGEGGQEVKYGTGGRRRIDCIIKTDEQTNYDIKVVSIESVKGATTEIINKWAISKDWKGAVSAGMEQEQTVLLLDIPRDAPTTTAKITLNVKNTDTGTEQTKTLFIDIVTTGFIQGAIC